MIRARAQGTAVSIGEFVSDNIWLVAIAVISGGYVVWPWISKGTSGVREVGPMEAVQLMNRNDAVVLDVREEGEFSGGHISGSKHVPLGSLEQRSGELKKFAKKPVVVVCASGARSRSACSTLKKLGFDNVSLLAGGIGAWRQASLPVEKS
ncbi:MAG: rhodanese-like domain-containing protein [Burkholderiales bacterium]|nr:rhodanese-like domain-containing protein [Burkholderiales bacterium]